MNNFRQPDDDNAKRRPYEHSPHDPCPECGGWLILFAGFEMYEDKPIAKNYHCEECDTYFSEGYPYHDED